ncbi:hypothetical protein WN51_05666 [Melipona quadrifasciata]|uniref:Uncharacterized protein n=1 Tax=Melipona quadrifasciata TaxID=166423 RepID=A0A0M8ZSG6_9HYME|nr:hypothetical protein WN51_05666 [Melipona quadrifasciata]
MPSEYERLGDSHFVGEHESIRQEPRGEKSTENQQQAHYLDDENALENTSCSCSNSSSPKRKSSTTSDSSYVCSLTSVKTVASLDHSIVVHNLHVANNEANVIPRISSNFDASEAGHLEKLAGWFSLQLEHIVRYELDLERVLVLFFESVQGGLFYVKFYVRRVGIGYRILASLDCLTHFEDYENCDSGDYPTSEHATLDGVRMENGIPTLTTKERNDDTQTKDAATSGRTDQTLKEDATSRTKFQAIPYSLHYLYYIYKKITRNLV